MNNLHRIEKIQSFLFNCTATLLSLVKIVMQSRPVKKEKSHTGSEIVVLGNGPSLRPMIETMPHFFKDKPLMAVNYAVLSDYFIQLQPAYYIVADSAFFYNADHCNKLFSALSEKISWDMQLFIPTTVRKGGDWLRLIASNTHIHLHYFNMTPVEGFRSFNHWAYRNQWGMPRPRNVLIPALMTALRLNFSTIYVAGADHSWLKEVWVDDKNRVMEDLHHFYDKKGSQSFQSDKHLHDLLLSMSIAFRSYHVIRDYAKNRGINIFNITEGSYIDAFDRKKIESE